MIQILQQVEPVVVHGERRLASPGIETSYHLEDRHFVDLTSDYFANEENEDDLIDAVQDRRTSAALWPQRLKARCRHFSEHFHGKEIYDMWLRTSAGK